MSFRAVILAGGNGERFWPLSTPERPKQFLDIFGKGSLLRQCVDRLLPLTGTDDLRVITSKALVALTRRELPELPRRNIVGEPLRRDTAAAVALAVSLSAPETDDDPVVGVFPSDQLVTRPAAFRATVRRAIRCAGKGRSIVTIGIRPTAPSTAFGYIDPSSGAFVEKPSERRAKEYLRRGYLWNAGMFIARASVFRAAFARFAPAFTSVRLADYPDLPRISFDYAVMERFPSVEVVPGDFGWDDVGGYGAFEKHFPRTDDGSVRLGDVRGVDSRNCTCIARGARIVTLGVDDLVVVTTGDAVLVAAKSKIGGMKKLFA